MMQHRATVVGRDATGGGQRGQASIYHLSLADGRRLKTDYIEIASDGFRTLAVGEEVWCSIDEQDPQWAVYVIPIRDVGPRDLLGLDGEDAHVADDDPITMLWL